ncbi:heterokaryon incompatibility protein-domain-containing protein [Phyllosticta citribraziliensis]|uniref:Heterokaryon incompatibility protein-domain-containing protein n=1 Tax=Phyllosticta citribraziliensis TaxID=989973 RepID=A0ABR1M556_9PEZI
MAHCELCQSVFENSEGFDGVETVFEWLHAQCSSCGPQNKPVENLCPYCQHLRLPHLILCLLNTERITDQFPTGVKVPFLRFDQISVEKCDVCCMLTRVLDAEHERIPAESPDYVGALLLLPQCWRPRLAKRPIGNRVAAIQLISPDGDSGRKPQWRTIYNDLGSDHDSTAHSRTLYLHQPMSQSQTLLSAQLRPTIDWDRIRWLLLTCRLGHPKCNSTSASRLPENFRVIDVLKRCIKKADQGCHFVALSYVWGEKPDFTKLMATKDSLRMLEREGSLTETKTPRTISDAMEACIQLGERSLWADRLCIIQDDEVGKQKQVDSMAAIFGSARFTIAATTGTVDTGIIGISSQRTSYPHMGCRINNLEMVVLSIVPQDFADTSMWGKRGWTLQEKVLSKRVLYITQNQAFLGCHRDLRYEDVRLRSVGRYRPDQLDVGGSVRSWGWHLKNYIVRNLSDTGDVFNAFAGIAYTLYPCPRRPLYGLPRPDFDRCLLWGLGETINKETVGSPQPLHQIPTWSWAYAKNFPNQPFDVSKGFNHEQWVETLVRWGCLAADSESHAFEWTRMPSRVKSDLISFAPLISENEYWTCALIAVSWRSGCIEAEYPFSKSTELSFSTMTRDLQGLFGSLEHLPQAWLDLVGKGLHARGPQGTGNSDATAEPYLSKDHRQLLRPGILLGRTQAAVFNVFRDTVTPQKLFMSRTKIRDHHENIVGSLGCFPRMENHDGVAATIYDDQFDVELISLSLAASLEVHILEHCMEMTVLGEICGENSYLFDAKHLSGWLKDFTIFDGEGNHMPFIPLVNVMAIEWNGPYARRLTVGWMLLSSWIEAEREFKTILLE